MTLAEQEHFVAVEHEHLLAERKHSAVGPDLNQVLLLELQLGVIQDQDFPGELDEFEHSLPESKGYFGIFWS